MIKVTFYRRLPQGLFCLGFLFADVLLGLQHEPPFSFPVSHYQLKNGLNVIVSEDRTLPIVSVVVAYRAGSASETPGKSGLAYFNENLMFLGSLNIGPMQHVRFLSRIGGELSARTTEDLTYFYQTVPANQLALVLWLESDRLKALEVDAMKIERVRQDILKEIVQQKEEPYRESSLAFYRLIYPDFAHGHDILGREEDIRSIDGEDVKAFRAAHYVPNNAVLVIAGQVDAPRARELVERYFEGIEPGRKIPVSPPLVPPERRKVTEVFRETQAPSPAFYLGYQIAAPFSPDYYSLVVADYLLLKGTSSRLFRRIIRREGLAVQLSGGVERRRELAAFKIFAVNNNETMVELSQRAIFSEMNRLRTSPVSEGELRRAKNLLKRDHLNRVATPLERAMFLAEMFFSPLRPEEAQSILARYMRVTPFEISASVGRYLVPENSVVLNVKSR